MRPFSPESAFSAKSAVAVSVSVVTHCLRSSSRARCPCHLSAWGKAPPYATCRRSFGKLRTSRARAWHTSHVGLPTLREDPPGGANRPEPLAAVSKCGRILPPSRPGRQEKSRKSCRMGLLLCEVALPPSAAAAPLLRRTGRCAARVSPCCPLSWNPHTPRNPRLLSLFPW
jgi:hypothetical protein